jgi:hypothetical protein
MLNSEFYQVMKQTHPLLIIFTHKTNSSVEYMTFYFNKYIKKQQKSSV